MNKKPVAPPAIPNVTAAPADLAAQVRAEVRRAALLEAAEAWRGRALRDVDFTDAMHQGGVGEAAARVAAWLDALAAKEGPITPLWELAPSSGRGR